jgi:hypothetical protein
MFGILQAGNVAYSSFSKKIVNRVNLRWNETAHAFECKRVDRQGAGVERAPEATFQDV